MQIRTRGEGNGMDHEINLAPIALQAIKHGLHLAGRFHIQFHRHARAKLFGKRADMRFGLVIQPSDRKLRTKGAQLGGSAKSDGIGIGNAHHQSALALQHITDALIRISDGG